MLLKFIKSLLFYQCLGLIVLIYARFDIHCGNDSQVYPDWLVSQPCFEHPFHDMYIFGDSYSDNGKPLKSWRYYEEHYFPDRYSNGPMCVEYLVRMMGANLYNFAYSGATVDNSITYRNTLDIHEQLETFRLKGGPVTHPDTTLYGFWIGTNDVEEIFKMQPSRRIRERKVDRTLESLYEALETLYHTSIGPYSFSLVKHIVVLGLLPIDHMPIISTMISDESERGPMTDLVARFNKGLKALAIRFNNQYKDARVYFYDTDWYSDQFFNGYNPLFTDVVQPCFTKTNLCPDENRHLWWDDYHPTTATSFLIAKDMYQFFFG